MTPVLLHFQGSIISLTTIPLPPTIRHVRVIIFMYDEKQSIVPYTCYTITYFLARKNLSPDKL